MPDQRFMHGACWAPRLGNGRWGRCVISMATLFEFIIKCIAIGRTIFFFSWACC